MKTPHTATNTGRWVLCTLRDGTRVKGRFLDRTDRAVTLRLEDGSQVRILKCLIKSFAIYKGDDHAARRRPK